MRKMTKLICNALCRGILLFLFAFMNVQVFAYQFVSGGIYYNRSSSNTVSVTYGGNDKYSPSKYSGNITIPETVKYNSKTYKVTSIGSYAFYNSTNLTSIILPDNLTTIDIHAFSQCSGLTSIIIPDNVTSIGEFAFYACTSLTSINIPDKITSISLQAFTLCTSLTSVTIPESVTEIGDDAFGSTGLISITFPDSVTIIGSMVCYECTNLTSVTIGSSVTDISGEAFYNCTSLTSVTIGSSVKRIQAWAFCGCTSLTEITIPDGVTSIGSNAFSRCSSLTEINSKNPTPPTIESDTFYMVDKNTCVLNVPIGSKELYENADYWKEFYNINEEDFSSGIGKVSVDGNEVEEVSRYTLDGKNIQTPQSGINIIKYSDGSTKKVLVK